MPTDREIFFYDHAGYSYASGADEAEQERARENNARELAEAEETATRRGWYVATQYDHDNCADPDDDETAAKLAGGELERLVVILCNEDGRWMETLGSVIVNSDNDPYVRVVAAELARELINSHRECGGRNARGRVTCGGCGRAWCGECDPAPSALCHWCHGRGWSEAEMEPASEYA